MFTLAQILETAINAKASDVHMAVGLPPICRVNGALLHMGEEQLTHDMNLKFAEEILGPRLYADYLETAECDASYTYREVNNFRVNVFNQKGRCGIVMRLIPSVIPTLETLKLPDVFREMCMKRSGLILLTGPTGSGKTTTLAAMIDYMSKTRNEHIITIEDPVEFIFPHGSGIVNQRQLGSDTRSFDAALRSALREDIDIIMVGEMRDLATISAAVTAAETGHLVMSTLHTIGAANTIDRIIDVFPGDQQPQIRAQLGAVLQAVISQQLLPNRAKNGRELALEVMIGNHAILNLIREGKTAQIPSIMQLGANEGMVTMDQSLIALYKRGRIDVTTLKKYAVNLNEVKRLIGEV